MKYLRQLRCKCYSAHKLPEVAPPPPKKKSKSATSCVSLATSAMFRCILTNPLQNFVVLLNKNLKGKAFRSYDGEAMPFLKLPPQNSCVTSKAKGPLDQMLEELSCCSKSRTLQDNLQCSATAERGYGEWKIVAHASCMI